MRKLYLCIISLARGGAPHKEEMSAQLVRGTGRGPGAAFLLLLPFVHLSKIERVTRQAASSRERGVLSEVLYEEMRGAESRTCIPRSKGFVLLPDKPNFILETHYGD
jgi:hypothetical protein